MTDEKIGEKEKIQILLAECNSLRAEINARISSSFTVYSIAAAVFVWLLGQQFGTSLLIGSLLAAVGLTALAVAIIHDCVRAALRVMQIEREINKRANERLLVWETYWGGQAGGAWRSSRLRKLLRLDRPPYWSPDETGA
jgi:hypothetical protein